MNALERYDERQGETELDVAGIERLRKADPEQAAIVLDYSIKHQVAGERENWITRAQMIYYMKETDLWRHHPASFSTFYEYCAQPEIDTPPSVISDMLAVCKYAPPLLSAGIDIWDVIRRAGHSKVRQIVPHIREAHRNGVLKEEVGDLVAAIDSMSFREVLEFTSTSGVRTQVDLAATWQVLPSGEVNVIFKNLDIDEIEALERKAGIKRWFDERGNRIDSPLNDPDAPKQLKKD